MTMIRAHCWEEEEEEEEEFSCVQEGEPFNMWPVSRPELTDLAAGWDGQMVPPSPSS